MVWSARTSQLVCFSYMIMVVWAINHFARPGVFAVPFTPLAGKTVAASLATGDQPAETEPTRADWTRRFARPSPVDLPVSEDPEYPNTGRPILLPTIAVANTEERLLPALLAHPQAELVDALALPDEIAFATSQSPPLDTPFETPTDEAAAQDIPLLVMTGEAETNFHPESANQPPAADRTRLASAAGEPSAAGGIQASSAAGPATYRVQRGDTLRTIAQRALGRSDSATIKRIIASNPRLRRNPDHLRIGQELILPKPTRSDDAVGAVTRRGPQAG